MEPLASFFQSGQTNDRLYMDMRDRSDLAKARRFVEELWLEYQPLADRHFLIESRNHFFQRFWEMYLGVALLRRGFSLTKVSDEGPEFYFLVGGKRVWVEAVAPGPGTGPDAVPHPRSGQAYSVPQEQILLRFTNALAAKLKKYNDALEKGIVDVSDHYVVAINCRGIPHAAAGSVLPYGLMAYLPIGHPAVTIDKEKREIVDSYFQYRDQVTKGSGAPVRTDSFLNPSYAGISGILHSGVFATEHRMEIGGDFCFLHNPLASQAIDKSVLSFCRQYVYSIEAGNLQTLEPEHSRNRDAGVQ